MIFAVNTSGAGIEFVLGEHYKSIIPEKQSTALPAAANEFIAECGITWGDITAIAVVVGPGSFTGIRLGIAFVKGIAIGLNIPVIPVNAFELYLADTPDAFVAIESGRGDFFVGAANLPPQTMDIDELESRQMAWPRTVGHRPFNMMHITQIAEEKLATGGIEPVMPMYLRKSYAEEKKEPSNDNKKY
ncbi:MAG: tRNA (adenosine(37)-N6)-threonylcarbamoyltransferase complex dimerization subunit type 1 TsaB [Alphaproteobacteria bacterium]|nr:tRNA (adenosine(37)-N6)-threonylcarbamoyltransferase complex dimerization subunit type 1 TsaB [Alphaproteobacteria bacterium]